MSMGCVQAVVDGYAVKPWYQKVRLLDGTVMWKAQSSIPDLITNNLYLYSDIGGTGFHNCKITASRKAVSEVIERRAYLEVSSQVNKKDSFGFNLFSGTTGMAAYPSAFSSSARKIALLEAEERWSVLHWWHGFLPCSLGVFRSIPYLVILNQFKSVTVISWFEKNDRRAYGFAAGKTIERAFNKSLIELSTNQALLENWSGDKLPDDATWIEKRLTFFSSSDGKKLFDERVAVSSKMHSYDAQASLVIDTEIKGPWTRYAKVWRCLYEGMEKWNDRKPINIFYF